MTALAKAETLLAELVFAHHTPRLAVAVSGGADSMALALLAHEWATSRGGHITTLTVDHCLRPESTAEAQQVAKWMGESGIQHHILTPHHADISNNLQEAARAWRYDALAEYCRAHGILHCLIAHHAGDQRETVALHTARGETSDGASGMALVRNYRGVRFLRPLLGIEKENLKKFLHDHAAQWVEDPSNANTDFARVRMRQQLAGDAAQSAALSTQAMEEGAARASRDDALAVAAMRLVTIHPLGFADLMLDGLLALEPTLATQLLADILATISGATERPRGKDTLRLAEALRANETKKRTLHGCEITVKNGIIRTARELARVAAPITLSGKGQLQWDERFDVAYDLPSGAHLHLGALGSQGRKQLSTSVPASTPAVSHLDEAPMLPHMATGRVPLPFEGWARIGFAPPKPLAAAPFWWLK